MFRKSKVIVVFAQFKLMIKKPISSSIQIICLDGRGEFDDKLFCYFFKSHSSTYQLSCPYTLAENGVIERKLHDIVEKEHCLLLQVNFTPTF